MCILTKPLYVFCYIFAFLSCITFFFCRVYLNQVLVSFANDEMCTNCTKCLSCSNETFYEIYILYTLITYLHIVTDICTIYAINDIYGVYQPLTLSSRSQRVHGSPDQKLRQQTCMTSRTGTGRKPLTLWKAVTCE